MPFTLSDVCQMFVCFPASLLEASPALAQTGFPHVTISTCNDFAIRKTKTSLFAPLGFLVRGAIMFGAITQVCCSTQPCYVPVGR